MCLAIPGRIASVAGEGMLRTGTVDFGGVLREVCLACVPEAEAGTYVIVHAGFALGAIDEEEATATLATLRSLGELETELGPEPDPGVGP